MKRFSLRPVTIQGRLLALFVVAAALPLAVVSLISYHNSVESVEKMVGNRVSRLASSVGEELTEKVRRRLGDRILIANDPLQRYLEGSLLDSSAEQDLKNYMNQVFQEYGRYYRGIIVADADGNPIFRGGTSRGSEQARPGLTTAATATAPTDIPGTPDVPQVSDSVFTGLYDEIPVPGLEQEMAELQARLRDQEIQIQIQNKRLKVLSKKKGVPEPPEPKEAPMFPDIREQVSEAFRAMAQLDPDFVGPLIPRDNTLPVIIETYRRQFTEEERLAARTGARLQRGENMFVFHRGEGGQIEAVRLLRPVYSVSEPDRRLGLLILDLRADYLFPEDLSGQRFGSKGDLVIVNRNDGEIIYDTRPDFIGLRLRNASPELSRELDKVDKENPTPYFSVKDAGDRRLAAIHPIGLVDWAVVATALPREFETEAREAGLLNLAVASAAVLLAFGFLLVSSRRISQSVHVVTEGAREIAAGNLDHTIEVQSRDEIQTLADTFNAMTMSLRENIALREKAATELEALNRTLEDRVAARTRELQTLNEALGRANQELQELDRLKSNFLATVSHEFKTPLTSITAFSEILSDEMEERRASPEVLRFLSIINNESGRLGRLIRNLLDLSRIEARRMRWERSVFRVRDVVDASLDGLLPVFSEKNIQVHHTIDCPDAQMNADRDRIQQVITNLIENAVKFSRKGSRIWIECRDSNHSQNGTRFLEFSVRDEGPGIPPSQLVRIFERFTQVDSTDTRGTGGSGLGLAISKEIVEHHGGSIWVESSTGSGASFHFTIPRMGEETHG